MAMNLKISRDRYVARLLAGSTPVLGPKSVLMLKARRSILLAFENGDVVVGPIQLRLGSASCMRYPSGPALFAGIVGWDRR